MAEIGSYSYDEYLDLIESFHGYLAPGLLIGGFMVDMAQKNLPPGEVFDAICETKVCLPDAVQLLTTCTLGNGWLQVFEFGRFAIAMYEFNTGEGVRIFLDAAKLDAWPEIKGWFLKLKRKEEQDMELLLEQIKQAGTDILTLQKIRVDPESLRRTKIGAVSICPTCREAYPLKDGESCRACQGESPYL